MICRYLDKTTDSDGIKKPMSKKDLKVFPAMEIEEIFSIIFETKEKIILL